MLDKLPYDRQNIPWPPSLFAQTVNENTSLPPIGDTTLKESPALLWPVISLVDKKGVSVSGDPFITAAKLLSEGNIIAIKGIGGFHIAVDLSTNFHYEN
jgi:hydrogenase maturation protein HypF